MDFSRFFIDRPIFAAVLSIVIFAAGLIAIPLLPVGEYPDVVPPSVVVRTVYPGANPKVIAAAAVLVQRGERGPAGRIGHARIEQDAVRVVARRVQRRRQELQVEHVRRHHHAALAAAGGREVVELGDDLGGAGRHCFFCALAIIGFAGYQV